MARHQRTKSESGYYHVMLRGNEKKNIFLDEDDKLRFIETVYQMKKEQRFYLHAFVLMDNHVHMMISEGTEDIAKTIKRISVSYVYFFNKKHKRVGHLFQDRFKSEVVDDDSYVLALARYIHQNPVKANMVKSSGEYKWSSYNGYLDERNYIASGLDSDVLLGLFSDDIETARKLFAEYMVRENEDSFLDIVEKEEPMGEEEAKELYEAMLAERGLNLPRMEKEPIPDEILMEFKAATKLSIRKIAVITGLNKDKLSRILRDCRQ